MAIKMCGVRTRVWPRRSQDQGRAIAQELAVAELQCDVIGRLRPRARAPRIAPAS